MKKLAEIFKLPPFVFYWRRLAVKDRTKIFVWYFCDMRNMICNQRDRYGTLVASSLATLKLTGVAPCFTIRRDNQCVLEKTQVPERCTTPQNVSACTCLSAHPPRFRHRGETLALPSGALFSSGSSTALTPAQDG